MRSRTGINAAGAPIDRDPEPENLKPSEQADRYNRPGVASCTDVMAFSWGGAIYCPGCADRIQDPYEPPTVIFRDGLEDYDWTTRQEWIDMHGEDPGPVQCSSCERELL